MDPLLRHLEDLRRQREEREARAAQREEARRHAHLKADPRYGNWKAMVARATNPSNKNYAGRGIGITAEWLGFPRGFLAFCEAMGEKPSDAHSVERLDVNAGYGPANCVWGDFKVQARNTRRNHKVTWEGKEHCLMDLAVAHGLSFETLYMRLEVYRWPLEKALATPKRNKGNVSGHGSARRKPKAHELLAARLEAQGLTGAALDAWAKENRANPYFLAEYLSSGTIKGWEDVLPALLARVEAALKVMEESHAGADHLPAAA